MVTRLSKTRHSRGHVSAGHGRIGKHRSHPGGRGLAGGMHHNRIAMNKYHPDYFGKVGMRRFHQIDEMEVSTINVDQLWTLVPEAQRNEFLANPSTENAPIIDVTQHGFFKVLGRGILPKCPVVIRCKAVSRIAEEQIKAVGGAVQLI